MGELFKRDRPIYISAYHFKEKENIASDVKSCVPNLSNKNFKRCSEDTEGFDPTELLEKADKKIERDDES